MQIARNSLDTQAGPSDWFTGAVYIDAVAAPSGPSRLSASSVHFTPGARTVWEPGSLGRNQLVGKNRGQAEGLSRRISATRAGCSRAAKCPV